MKKDNNPSTDNQLALERFLDALFKHLGSFFEWLNDNLTMLTITFTGSLFIATTNWHVLSIIPLTSKISGFYLFCFTMVALINIFASITYEKSKTVFKLILCTLFTGLLIVSVSLFLKEINLEVKLGLASRTINMKKSQVILITGLILSVIGIIRGWINLFIKRSI